ncbi:SRPBCC family protein [Leucobacter luti]|uniref:SRPBCC family protein n=1 Tax=Leucobacter luti TaxID=340320 RepID=UPI003CFC3685
MARSRVNAARAAVWAYLSEEALRGEWWPELRLEPKVGGEVSERWSEGEGDDAVSRDASGTVDVWVDGHAIGFTWRESGDPRDTAVLVTLRSQGYETGITVTETGFDALPSPAERAAASQEGWAVLLRDLTEAVRVAVESGTIGADGVVAGAGGGAAVDAVAVEAEAVDVGSDDADAEADGDEAEVAGVDGAGGEGAGVDGPDGGVDGAGGADDGESAEPDEPDADPDFDDLIRGN